MTDTERLDWLESQMPWSPERDDPPKAAMYHFTSPVTGKHYEGESLRAMIDREMEKEKMNDVTKG